MEKNVQGKKKFPMHEAKNNQGVEKQLKSHGINSNKNNLNYR